MDIICIGDSLTAGSVGHSYISFLGPGLNAANAGKNGDTLWGMTRRLNRLLGRPAGQRAAVFVVCIGVNDLFIPHLAGLSPFWRVIMGPRAVFRHCLTDDGAFAAAYDAMLQKLAEQGKPAVVVGMPFVEKAGFPLGRLQQRNELLRELAGRRNLPFVDLLSLQLEGLEPPKKPYSWRFGQAARLADIALMCLFPKTKDWLARRRQLQRTVDGIHFSKYSARALGEAVRKAVEPQNPNPA